MKTRHAATFVIALTLSLVSAGRAQIPETAPGEVTADVPKGETIDAWLKSQAFQALDRRDAAFEKLSDAESHKTWQTQRKTAFLQAIGGFPERTPLNPKITGRRSFAGHRIEKLYFESQPGFHVTATLYLPLGEGPFPGIVHPTGHSSTAKNRDLYQRASVIIARGGFAVLCYDPVGQGERRQLFKRNGSIYSSTQEHTLINQGSILLGSNTARTMIWDGMRAIDYLQSRSDIISDKIGCTGISGGGMNTAYLMALDDRIEAAAPGCYLTGYRRLLSTIGVQDAEQNIHGQLEFGLDHADYVLMCLPRPTLIMAATQDYFDIKGAWNLFRQGKRFATNLGFPERVDLVETNTSHGFPDGMALAAGNWFRRWLLESDEPMKMPEVTTLPEEELNSTPTGKVLELEGARTIYDLNIARAERLAKQRGAFDPAKVRELIGARELTELPKPMIETKGTEQPGRAVIERLVIRPEPGIWLVAQRVSPPRDADPAKGLLFLTGDEVTNHEAEILKLAGQGHTVLAADLRGFGERNLRKPPPTFEKLVGPDWRQTTMAYLLGKSTVGVRTEDVWHYVQVLREQPGFAGAKPNLIAVGEAAIPALHAAVLEPDLFGKVTIRECLQSWEDVVSARVKIGQYTNVVHGALRHYDLPDLVSRLGDRLTVERPIRADDTAERVPIGRK